MLSFCKEAVAVVQPQASLLAGTIASGAPPHASRPGAPSAARSSRADSAAAALCGVTSQRSVFTVAQVVAAVLAEAHPLGDAPAADAEERAAAAAALVDRFDLRVCDDDGSVDPDFPPIDSSVSLTSVGASVFVLCDSNTDVPLLQLAVPEEQQDASPYAAAAAAASDGRPVDSPSSLAAQAERAHMSPVAGAPSHGNREDGGGGGGGGGDGDGGDGGDGGRLGAGSGDGEPAWLHVTCCPPTLRALARATSAGQRAPSGSRAPPSPSPFAARTEPFTVRVRLQPALGGPP
jgi:hypothetical protein